MLDRKALIKDALNGNPLPMFMLEYFVHCEVRELLEKGKPDEALQFLSGLKSFHLGRRSTFQPEMLK
jgi:hypothetical protein